MVTPKKKNEGLKGNLDDGTYIVSSVNGVIREEISQKENFEQSTEGGKKANNMDLWRKSHSGTKNRKVCIREMPTMLQEMQRHQCDQSRMNKERGTKEETQEVMEGQVMQGPGSQCEDAGSH